MIVEAAPLAVFYGTCNGYLLCSSAYCQSKRNDFDLSSLLEETATLLRIANDLLSRQRIGDSLLPPRTGPAKLICGRSAAGGENQRFPSSKDGCTRAAAAAVADRGWRSARQQREALPQMRRHRPQSPELASRLLSEESAAPRFRMKTGKVAL